MSSASENSEEEMSALEIQQRLALLKQARAELDTEKRREYENLQELVKGDH